MPALLGKYQLQNSAAVIQVCQLLQQQGLAVSEQAIRSGLETVRLSGRFQIIPGTVTRILDVTHNQQGAENLRDLLQETPHHGKTFAVLAMLKDKDCKAVATALEGVIDHWFVAGLEGQRGMSGKELAQTLSDLVPTKSLEAHDTVADAYETAMRTAKAGDRLLIFGSFHTVEAAMLLIPECQLPVSQAV
jgi:dihydrofolate synthase/folylpolyglutamate synthase